MLRISKLADYATVVVSLMARSPGETHSAAKIAERLDIGQPTISKILKLLARAKLLSAQRGVNGGYALARAPAQISIADIIDAIEGNPLGLTECSTMPGLCAQESACEIRANWRKISLVVRRALAGVTLADMVLPQSVSAPVAMFAPAKRLPAGGRSVPLAGARERR
ncbi:MAG: SUF system Fe-S cluster assembly regulator [Burkholderiales bacterium]